MIIILRTKVGGTAVLLELEILHPQGARPPTCPWRGPPNLKPPPHLLHRELCIIAILVMAVRCTTPHGAPTLL